MKTLTPSFLPTPSLFSGSVSTRYYRFALRENHGRIEVATGRGWDVYTSQFWDGFWGVQAVPRVEVVARLYRSGRDSLGGGFLTRRAVALGVAS